MKSDELETLLESDHHILDHLKVLEETKRNQGNHSRDHELLELCVPIGRDL